MILSIGVGGGGGVDAAAQDGKVPQYGAGDQVRTRSVGNKDEL